MLYCWSHFLVDSFSIALLFSNYLHTSITMLHFCPSSIEILYLQYFSHQLKHSTGTVTVWEEVEVSWLLTALLRLDVEPDTLLRNDALILPFAEKSFLLFLSGSSSSKLYLSISFVCLTSLVLNLPAHGLGLAVVVRSHLPLSHELREGVEQPKRCIPLGQQHHSVPV